ncbi:50S ribosomal protein L6 [Candidatus Scalindua japonica]|uniref:Large ribosomal subunit protein uL6 n=1 Tax=Candidatus Scalindua japonica TaxID=1284222 RepID=A0A286U2B8_9BACT|nr:50S ribosomal protein L6 [Candidatus Scalindua japonica]GAX62272.1 50S ribosomal protein L6 [Candidatus Scalindua japonica]
MSRIGKKPIAIPDGVRIKCDKDTVTIEGPKGKIVQPIHSLMKIEVDEGAKLFSVVRPSEERQCKELHGLTRTLLANNVIGVTNGFSKSLEIIGLGYNIKMQGQELVLQLGFSHPIKVKIPEDINIEIQNQTNPGKFTVAGIDKQQVGQFAANIRRLRPPEPYKGKGVKYADEIIRRKAGKAVASSS